jgi:phage gp36-like protein
MSAYITSQQAKDRLARQYTSLYTVGSSVDESLITDDIAAAEAEVNGYLARRYAVPVTAALDLVSDWCLTLVEYRAYRRAPGAEIPAKIKDAAAVVRKALADIAASNMDLPGVAEDTSDTSGGFITAEANTPEMTRTKLSGW